MKIVCNGKEDNNNIQLKVLPTITNHRQSQISDINIGSPTYAFVSIATKIQINASIE